MVALRAPEGLPHLVEPGTLEVTERSTAEGGKASAEDNARIQKIRVRDHTLPHTGDRLL